MVKKFFEIITEFSLRLKWITILISVLFLVLGVVAFTQFNQELIPDLEFPQTFILIQSSGMTPEDLLNLMTIPIEDRVKEREDVLNIESTTGGGFAFVQVSNEFGLDQKALRADICGDMNTAWLTSGLARAWDSLDWEAICRPDEGIVFRTSDVTPEAIEEAWVKWPYLLDDLTFTQLLSLPAGAIQALPDAFLRTLPGPIQKALLDIADGAKTPVEAAAALPNPLLNRLPKARRDALAKLAESEAAEPLAMPQSWLGLSRTSDLTPEAATQVLEKAPTMAEHFRNDDGMLIESYIFAMPPDVIRALPDDLFTGLSECSQQQLDALLSGELEPDPPVQLPGAWRAQPPGIITFSFADIPLAFVSISGTDLTPAELRDQVDNDIVPRLAAVEGIADAPMRGGQLLPGDEGAEALLAAEETNGENPGGTPLPAQSLWKLIGQQFAAMLGSGIETYGDLSPEVVTLVLDLAGGMVENLNIPLLTADALEARLLDELANEDAVQALPADTLAWMPADYTDRLDDDLRAAAKTRVEENTRYDAIGAAARQAEESGQLPVYFQLFSQLGQQFGLPLTINTPKDLTPEIVSALNALVPGGAGTALLHPLSAAAWEQVPAETLGWLPPDFAASLPEEAQTVIQKRAEAVGGVGALAEAARENGDLPPFFELIAQQPLLGGVRLCGPEDLSAELVSSIGSFMPDVLAGLPPAAMRRLSPEALAALPAPVVEELPGDLRAELEDKAESAGGLGAAAGGGDGSSSSPSMPASWDNPQIPKTAGEMVNSQYGAAGFMNLLFGFLDKEGARQLFGDLTPEHINYFIEQEEGFLDALNPAVMSFFPPEVLDTLPETYQEIARNAFVPEDAVTRTNGEPSLVMTVYKDAEANTVEAAHHLFEELDAIEEETGLKFVTSFEQASFIEESIGGVAREGGLGAVFAVVVIFFFLHRSWRSTIVTAVSIPLSVMVAFVLMRWFSPAMHGLLAPLAEQNGIWGFLVTFFPAEVTLNIMTLSGLTVAIGRVVDDSIVVLENIYRHIHNGEDPETAVRAGTRDVSIAILASTVTTIAVFLPIGMAGGLVGAFFIPFGMAVSYALGASFVVAITVIPVLARWFIRREHMPEETETIAQRWYTPALKWSLSHRAVVLVVTALLFMGSLWLMAQRPQAFIPPIGEPQMTVEVSMPEGTSIIETNRLSLEMEQQMQELQQEERIGDYQTIVGGGASLEALIGGSGVNQTAAQLTAAIPHGQNLDRLAQNVRARAEEVFGTKNVTVSAATISETGFGGLGLVLSGDLEKLKEIDQEVIEILSDVEGVANVSSTLEQASQAGDQAILRVNQQPAVKYTAEFETDDTLGTTAAAKKALNATLQEKDLAEDIIVSEGFESEVQTEGFQSIFGSLGLAVIVVYGVMVLTFRSFVHPFTILFTVPLAVVGAAIALALSNRVLGLPAMVGLLMLIGIVVTNAIVMIDRVQSNRKERNMGGYDALVEGARTRLRPILMTALAAIFALIPLAMQLMGPGGAIVSAALGTVVIGGLLTSTFFTLLVVPVVYNLLDNLAQRVSDRVKNNTS